MRAEALSNPVYYEAKVNSNVFPVLPGFHKVIHEPGIAVTTLLGSCVAACIRDARTGIGGLNHFLLPRDRSEGAAGFSARYGVNAMEVLINEILRTGARKNDLEAKVFGAGNVIHRGEANNVGQQNAEFVVSYLRDEGIRLLASDLGGDRARRVFYFPETGKARVLSLSNRDSAQAGQAELTLEQKLRSEKKATPSVVELF
ncbi:chemoreceptor glutamine deamidase CheD [Algicella marina]|uniref:Probable chemoreceptor glutamine deamidase CheD n=1 Tax=Algicella marina TaxID=2683284 RepID=A0A6P1T4F6_9RHOB|nr:chemoreceptor glutamine deamidase CheD [Algicella marina]QHQ36887.1 chemoreceptor glutamine deamidase CheD [Algicella marina]